MNCPWQGFDHSCNPFQELLLPNDNSDIWTNFYGDDELGLRTNNVSSKIHAKCPALFMIK